MTTDFRRVYATMIEEWLGCSQTSAILKGEFETFKVFAPWRAGTTHRGVEATETCYLAAIAVLRQR